MNIEILQVAGINHALRWMRYAKQTEGDTELCDLSNIRGAKTVEMKSGVWLGPRDERLARALVAAPRDSHSKMCRVIQVWMDVTAPLKWWKQFDTYKVGTVALSTSTMNSIMDRELTVDDFGPLVEHAVISMLNDFIRGGYEQSVFANLPLDYLQLRGVLCNYQVLRNIYLDRQHHKLGEWQTFLSAIREQCPYSEELIFCE
jgi:hypothetical protein